MSTIVNEGQQITLIVGDWFTMVFDWSDHVADEAGLTAESATDTAFVVEDVTIPAAMRQTVVSVEVDSVIFEAGSNNKAVIFRIKALPGSENHVYRVRHNMVTTENPVQKRSRAVYAWVRQAY